MDVAVLRAARNKQGGDDKAAACVAVKHPNRASLAPRENRRQGYRGQRDVVVGQNVPSTYAPSLTSESSRTRPNQARVTHCMPCKFGAHLFNCLLRIVVVALQVGRGGAAHGGGDPPRNLKQLLGGQLSRRHLLRERLHHVLSAALHRLRTRPVSYQNEWMHSRRLDCTQAL